MPEDWPDKQLILLYTYTDPLLSEHYVTRNNKVQLKEINLLKPTGYVMHQQV